MWLFNCRSRIVAVTGFVWIHKYRGATKSLSLTKLWTFSKNNKPKVLDSLFERVQHLSSSHVRKSISDKQRRLACHCFAGICKSHILSVGSASKMFREISWPSLSNFVIKGACPKYNSDTHDYSTDMQDCKMKAHSCVAK